MAHIILQRPSLFLLVYSQLSDYSNKLVASNTVCIERLDFCSPII
ncbi:TPA: hypothetical protein ACIFCK_002277 [Acinetobacter baumannii]